MPEGSLVTAPAKSRANRLLWLLQGLAKVPPTHEVCTLKGEASLLFLFAAPGLSFGCSTSAKKDWAGVLLTPF